MYGEIHPYRDRRRPIKLIKARSYLKSSDDIHWFHVDGI